MTLTTTTASATITSVYAAIHEAEEISTVVDGSVTVYPTKPANPTGAWAAIWWESETYADTCHAAADGVHVAHYDWALWYSDLYKNVGRIEEFDPILFATNVRDDLNALGERGARSLLRDAEGFLEEVKRRLGDDDVRGLPALHVAANTIMVWEDDLPEPMVEVAVGAGWKAVRILDGDAFLARAVTVTADTVTFDVNTPDMAGTGAEEIGAYRIEVPRAVITHLASGPFHHGEDDRLHYVGDDCSGLGHEVLTDPADANHTYLSCGNDFMGGTICSLIAGHLGPDGTKCLFCDGDWYMETCTCPKRG